MRKTQIMALVGIGTGVIGSITGAIITRNMYVKNKDKIESGEMNDEKEIKKAKWKTGTAAVGTTLLAGLAIASGVGLAISYTDEENEVGLLEEPKSNIDEDDEWIKALNEESDLLDISVADNNEDLHSMKDEIDEFVSSMNSDIEELEEMKEIGQNMIDSANEALEQLK